MFAKVLDKYQQLNNNILKLTHMKFFNEIYAGLLAALTVFGWKVNTTVGMVLMLLVSTIALLITRSLKYVIPSCIYFIFMFSEGFSNQTIPIPILILGSLFAIVICIFSFKDGFHFKKMKSFIGLTGLAITTIIPILWCRAPQGNEVFYFLFFGNLGYFILYIIMVNGIKGDAIDILAVSMSYLSVILACECGLKAYELRNTVSNILDLWYYLGWGLCNEAGIMICVSIPFAFYLLGKQKKLSGMIFQNFKIIFGIIGIILTTSRGSYLFGFLEIGILYIILMFTAKKARLYQNTFFVYAIIMIVVAICMKGTFTEIIEQVLHSVFNQGFDDNGRKELWETAFKYWNAKPHTRIFGAGFICYIISQNTALGIQLSPQVFHSTFFQTLAVGGLVGLLFLIIHFIEKYKNLYKCDKFFFLIIGIGFVMVDIYGMIDNTYHMYYFMIPLMIIMAVVDAGKDNLPKNTLEVN